MAEFSSGLLSAQIYLSPTEVLVDFTVAEAGPFDSEADDASVSEQAHLHAMRSESRAVAADVLALFPSGAAELLDEFPGVSTFDADIFPGFADEH
jgi:hypothetical protein